MRVGDPQWTARAEENEGVQDPLGMNRVMDRLLRDLLPGITTISPRPRYFAHHLWALRDVPEREDPESRAQLIRGLYQRERIFLLAGVRHSGTDTSKSHTNLVGARTANRLLNDNTKSVSLNFSFLSNRSGSYGQNYVGPLQTMGLVDTPDDALFEQVTERAEPIADAYAQVAEETNLAELAASDEISVTELDAIASDLCPCAVSAADAPDREALRELYLGQNSPEAYATQARTRRETLALILHTARVGGGTAGLNPSNLLDVCYYQAVMTDEEHFNTEIPSGLLETAAHWKALQAHDYFRYATEAALVSWLSYLKQTDEADATLEAFKQQARGDVVCERITDLLDCTALTPETSLSMLITALWPDTTSENLIDGEPITPVTMTHTASEYTLDNKLKTALKNQEWRDVHATWPCLLIAPVLRFAAPSGADEAAWSWLRSHTKDDLSPVRFRDHLKTHVAEEFSIRQFVDWMIEKYIIERRIEIAAGKGGSGALRGYFEQTGTGWRHVRDHAPGHWGARFSSAVSVLRDLALLDPDSSTAELTAAGVELLKTEGGVN